MLRAADGSPTLLRLPAERGALPRLIDWLDHRIALLGLSERSSFAIRLCIEEAVLNIITHGQPAPGGTVLVWVGHCAGRLSACIKDRGAAFDPLQAQLRPRPKNLAEAPVGGMGITLLRSFAAEIAYRRASGANRLLLCFEG